MGKSDRLFLENIRDAINKVESYLRDVSQKQFYESSLIQDGVIRQIMIMGEATKLLSQELRNQYSEIPWRAIARMRDTLVHRYFSIDLEQVWLTAQTDLAPLKRIVVKILNDESEWDNQLTIERTIRELAQQHAQELDRRMTLRVNEMKTDDRSHSLIYQVLGVSIAEGEQIDVYQNKGRFLYKYAGAFLERAAFLCFQTRFPHAIKAQVANTQSQRPRQFEIDCLIDNEAIEVKWRDATTDGDHITKEHARIQAIKAYGYQPVRLMFYYPNREQAIRIQAALKTLYHGIGGEYYAGDEAWAYVRTKTGVDLYGILNSIAAENQQ